MATAPLIAPKVDLYLNFDWIELPTGEGNISGVRETPPIVINGGIKNEASKISPSTCTMRFNNPNGDWDPRNPKGQYFGVLKKNTPLRIRVPVLTDNTAQTVSNGWGNATDVQKVVFNWTNNTSASSGGSVLATDWTRAGSIKSHSVPVAAGVRVSDLTASSWQDVHLRCSVTLPSNTVATAAVATTVKLRMVDNNNYIGVQFVFRTDESVGIAVIEKIAGTDRSLQADTTVLAAGAVTANQVFNIAVLAEGAIIRAKIWPVGQVEPFDWQTEATRATVRSGPVGLMSTLAAGNTNTKPYIFAYNSFVLGGLPFVGEINKYVPKYADVSHAAPYVDITASGITQRTEQGSEPLKSTMLRWWSSNQKWIREGAAESEAAVGDVNTLTCLDADAGDVAIGNFFRILDSTGLRKEDQLFTVTAKASAFGFTNIDFTPDALDPIVIGDVLHSLRYATATELPIAYWPMEEGVAGDAINSGLVNGEALSVRIGTPEFAQFDTFLGSSSLLKLNNSELFQDIPNYTDTNQAFAIHFLVNMPAVDEAASGSDLVQFYTDGNAEIWELQYATGGLGGDIVVRATDSQTGTNLFTTAWNMSLRGKPCMVTFMLQQTGPTTVVYDLTAVQFPINLFQRQTQTATGVTKLGKIKSIRINPAGGYVNVGFGHLSVVPAPLVYFNMYDHPNGNKGENVPRRMIRMGFEEDVPFTYYQGSVPATLLGPQAQDKVLSVMNDAAVMNMGRFYEARGAFKFEYRALSSLYLQTPFMTVDYSLGGVLSELVPADDDIATRNDIMVKRRDGGSAFAVQLTGPMSVLRPDQGGVGRYTDTGGGELNANTDDQLQSIADWKLHLGTVNEERFPTIKMTPAGSPIKLEALLSAGVGNRFKLTNLIARGRYEPIDQLILGYTIVLDQFVPTWEFNGEPARPYQVAQLDSGLCRLDSDTSTLNAPYIAGTHTTLSVATSGSTVWEGTDCPFEILVGGVRVRVNSITGAASPQTFNITTQPLNGLIKTVPANTPVSLADPVYLPY